MTGCSETNIPGAFPPLCLTAGHLSDFFHNFTTICLFFGLLCCLIGLGKQSGIISRSGSEAEAMELVKQCGDGAGVLGWCFSNSMQKLLVKNAAHSFMGLMLNLYQVLPLATCRAVLHLDSVSEAEGEHR